MVYEDSDAIPREQLVDAGEQQTIILEPGGDTLSLLLKARRLGCCRRRRRLVQSGQLQKDAVARGFATLTNPRLPRRAYVLLHGVAR